MTQKVITTLHYGRPYYTAQVLESLKHCIGIEDYLIVAYTHEGASHEVQDLLSGIDFCAVETHFEYLGVQRMWPVERLGRATHRVLGLGFERGDYVIHVEDDIVFAPDALRFFEYCRQFEDDPDVFTVTGYNRYFDDRDPQAISRHTVARRRWFHPWGWATWRSRWETSIRDGWDPNQWDNHMWWGIAQNRCEVYPRLARTLNVGAVAGANVPSAAWHEQNQWNGRWFAGQVEINTTNPFIDDTEVESFDPDKAAH